MHKNHTKEHIFVVESANFFLHLCKLFHDVKLQYKILSFYFFATWLSSSHLFIAIVSISIPQIASSNFNQHTQHNVKNKLFHFDCFSLIELFDLVLFIANHLALFMYICNTKIMHLIMEMVKQFDTNEKFYFSLNFLHFSSSLIFIHL